MSTSARTTWLTALAVVLTSASMARVFEGLGWVLPVLGAVVAVVLGGLLSQALRLPGPVRPLVTTAGVALYAAVLQAYDTFAVGMVPGALTLERLGTRLGEGLLDIEQLTPPVPTTPGLVLVALLGTGAVAVVADLLAVVLRRPALAGFPLLTLLVVPAATVDGGVGVVPFALGAVGWLVLLMADSGERVGRWGTALSSGAAARGATRSDESSLGRVGRRIGVAAVGTALVVPALVPGLEASLVDGDGGGGLGGSRQTTTFNPLTELGGQLRLPDPRPLLRYSTTDPAPDYLRLTTLDVFDDDSGWSSSELQADTRQDRVDRGIDTPPGSGSADVQPLTTEIEVQGLGGPWLPVPPVPTEIQVDGPWLWEAESQTVFSTRTDLTELDGTYRVTSERVLPSVERLRREGGVVPADVQELAVPPEVSDYVRRVTEEATAGATTGYEQASALQAFFREGNGFQYSEDADVPGIDAPNRLEAFLRGRQGFCEQYASAMAAMARVLGLPARVAVGFVPGSRQSDGTYQVTTSDAHAWPEIWFAGHGWLRFEPTPRVDQVVTPGYTTPPAPGEDPATPETVTPTQAPTTPADAGDAGASGDNARQLDDGGGLAASGDEPTSPATWVRRGLVVLALLALLAAPAAVAALRRRRRWRQPSPEAAWAQVVEDAVDVGHDWRRAESPRAAAARLARERGLSGAPAEALQRLAAVVERARYARPGSDDVEAAGLHADVTAVRAGLLASAGRRTRWTARVAPTSTLQWAAHASGTAVADGLDRVDELVSAVSSRLRRVGRRRAA